MIVETSDEGRIAELLSSDPITFLEALDESHHGVDGLVTVFAEEEVERPSCMLVVRWGQKDLGLGSLGQLVALRLSELPPLLEAFPERGQMDLRFPFWTSGAIAQALKTDQMSAEARYVVERGQLSQSNVVRQCQKLDDVRVVKPMFPKLADDTPVYVLSLAGELVAVAAATHLLGDVANLSVYTTEASRGRGFGRGVMTALAEELLALGVTPTVTVDLGEEAVVRMVENAGFRQHTTFLKTKVLGTRKAHGLTVA